METIINDIDLDASIQYASRILKLNSIKPQQHAALKHLLRGRDVFVNLPTGYGKSTIFHGAPLCKDFLNKRLNPGKEHPRSIALVISPITALIQDQVTYLNSVDIPAFHLQEVATSQAAIMNGNYSILFTSPEIATSQQGKELIAELRMNICGIFVDECHCIAKW
tara:strand:+ start:108 stop:602 length:495 start_codon:yes stop_codon:yes gene_type:complete